MDFSTTSVQLKGGCVSSSMTNNSSNSLKTIASDTLSTPNKSNGNNNNNSNMNGIFEAPDYVDGLQDVLLTGMGVLLVAGNTYMIGH